MRAVFIAIFFSVFFLPSSSVADEPYREGCLDPYLYACYKLADTQSEYGTDFLFEQVWVIDEIFETNTDGFFSVCNVQVRILSNQDPEIDIVTLIDDYTEYVVYRGKQMLRTNFDKQLEENECSYIGTLA